MTYKFLVNEVAGGWSPESRRLGGTEESIVEWAKRFPPPVIVYHNGKHGIWEGVEYKDRSEYKPDGGITINVKSSEVRPQEKTFYLTNETNANELDLHEYEAVIFPSRWAVDHIPVNCRTVILPHGYDSNKIKPGLKQPGLCIYTSSPDRGLTELFEHWPKIVEQCPEARLVVTYGGKGKFMPNTSYLGEIPEEQMNRLYSYADLWLHPCLGGELFGMSGIKAQAAGCVPVYYPTMALTETIKQGIRCSPGSFVGGVVSLLKDPTIKEGIRDSILSKHYVDWDESTDILKGIIDGT